MLCLVSRPYAVSLKHKMARIPSISLPKCRLSALIPPFKWLYPITDQVRTGLANRSRSMKGVPPPQGLGPGYGPVTRYGFQ